MTAAQVKAAIEGAETFTPEPPRPLRRELPPADAFPVDALGDVLGPAAIGIHEKVQAPVAICAMSVLGAATLACQAHADVRLPTGQVRPQSGYFVTIGASGERKSSTDTEALWPVRKHEENLRQRYDDELPGYLNERDAWAKQRDQILSDRKRHPDKHAKQRALDALGPAPQPPLNPMLICSEPTFEGLERLFPTGQPSMGVFSAEGGQYIGGHGMREEAKLRTAAALSSIWDGQPIRRVRAGDGALLLPGRRLALHLMVQPDIANILLSDRLLSDQGLLSRLLVSAPESLAGTRFWREPDALSDRAIRRYGARLLTILETALPLAARRVNELNPPAITLSAGARQTWIGFSNYIENEIRPGGSLETVRGLANKLAEHAARLAATLALVRDISAGEIAAEFADSGIELAQHFAAEALRLFDRAGVRPEIARAEMLLAWLQRTWPEALVSLPDIYQRGPSAIRDKKTAQEAVSILEDHGWLKHVEGGAEVGGARRQEVWLIGGGRNERLP
jgi:hypothetical protein